MPRREAKPVNVCAVCGKPCRGRLCLADSKAEKRTRMLAETEASDLALLDALTEKSMQELAVENGVTRVAIHKRYRKALRREALRAEAGGYGAHGPE